MFSSGFARSSNVTKLDGRIPCEIVLIRLFETNLGYVTIAEEERGRKSHIKLKFYPQKAISIYSSCNWVRFLKPNDKDSNWLSSRSLMNIQPEKITRMSKRSGYKSKKSFHSTYSTFNLVKFLKIPDDISRILFRLRNLMRR